VWRELNVRLKYMYRNLASGTTRRRRDGKLNASEEISVDAAARAVTGPGIPHKKISQIGNHII
jgi:hypothetical protein